MNPQEILAEVIEQLRGSWRYRWWAAAITWAISVVGWAYVYWIPDVYQASARVYVDTNSLLKPLMQGLTAQQNTMNEVQLVSTAVLTRPNLEAVARDTDLDLRARSQEQFEDLVTSLQRNIKVRGGGDNIFTIQYEDNTRDMARDVVAAVLDTFVEDAIGAQGDDAEITEKALAGEIQDHEQRLRSAESALAEFKKANLGYMPGESGDYYTRLQNALGQQATTEQRIRQLQERLDELNRQLDGEAPVFGIMPAAIQGPNCTQRQQISDLQSQLQKLLVDFTEKHPRVLALKDTIGALEERCGAEAASTPATAAAVGSGDSLEVNPVYQNLRIQASNAEVELVEARGLLKTHENTVAGLRRDVDKIAEVETQLKQLNRDYDVVQARHQELLRRWEDLQAKKRLDPVTDNVQFRRIEPPFALAEPVGPNRPLLLGGLLVAAVAAGFAVAFGMNQLHPVYYSRRRIRQVAGLPVLGAITMLLTPEVRAQRRRLAAAWVASYVFLLASATVVITYASQGSTLLRALAANGFAP